MPLRLSGAPTALAAASGFERRLGRPGRGYEGCFHPPVMRSVVAALGWLSIALVAACGGRTVTGSEAGEGTDEVAEPNPGSGSEEPAPGGGGDFPADTELGECQLGKVSWDVDFGCAWIADNRCYETRAMACNCACPRDRDSQCTSGFESGPNARVQVDCY